MSAFHSHALHTQVRIALVALVAVLCAIAVLAIASHGSPGAHPVVHRAAPPSNAGYGLVP